MLAARIAERVLSRTAKFAVEGVGVGGFCGVKAGVISGAIYNLIMWARDSFMSPPNSSSIDISISAFVIMLFMIGLYGLIGGILGIVTTSLSFGVAGALSGRVRDDKLLLKWIGRRVLKTSLWGTSIGALCGLMSTPLVSLLFRGNHSYENFFGGFIGGVICGFIIGNFYGAISSALAYQKEQLKHESSTRMETN